MSSEALGALLPSVRVPPPGPASRALAERLRAVESRNVTYVDDEWPVFWEEARGANVRDADGNILLDLTGGFGVALQGHGHPGVAAALGAQAGRLVHGLGDVHPPSAKVALLEGLARLMPWPDARGVLASTGSEAVEIALKSAHLATGKPGVVAFEGGYHGLTLGSLAVTWRDHFRAPFRERLYQGVAFAPFPEAPGGESHGTGVRSRTTAAASIDAVRRLLTEGAPNGDAIGAVIVEPVQGRGGVRIPPDGFMAELSALAAASGALVIADELLTGMGRCGSVLASDRVGLLPDLVCLGKALGGGLPLSACLAPRRVMEAWPPSEGEAIHTSTFLGHPLACAAALVALESLEADGVPARADALGASLRAGLARRLSGAPGVVQVRGLGLLIGVELGDGRRAHGGAGARVAAAALRRGVLVLPAGDAGEVVELTPPVVLTEAQADYAVEVLVSAIEEVV